MRVRIISKYHQHGHDFAGHLALVRYRQDLQRDSRLAKMQLRLELEYIEQAQRLVLEQYPCARRLAVVPDVVMEIN